MENNLNNLSDKEVYEYFENAMDNTEEFSAMLEMAYRKHPKISEICFSVINTRMSVEKNEHSLGHTSSALTCLYIFDKSLAIDFFKNHYKELPIDAFGSFLSDYTDTFYKSESIDNNLIALIKAYLKTLKQDQISEIQKDYDEFMKVYKSV